MLQRFAMGIKWVMLIKLLVYCQEHGKNTNVLYCIINVLILILSKNCGGHKVRHKFTGKFELGNFSSFCVALLLS